MRLGGDPGGAARLAIVAVAFVVALIAVVVTADRSGPGGVDGPTARPAAASAPPTASPARSPAPGPTATPATTPNGSSAHLEGEGLVVIEAEDHAAALAQGGKAWTIQESPALYAGSGLVAVTPNNGALLEMDALAASPQLRFEVEFRTPGRYTVWFRGYAASGGDDSLHVGLDGVPQPSAGRMTLATYGSWSWSKATMDGAPAILDVPSAGRHTLDVWMREDGLLLDRLMLTTSTTLAPVGIGPAESAYDGGPIPPGPEPNLTQLFDWAAIAPSPVARYESQGGVVDGKLYVLGGFYNAAVQATTRSDVYDPATDTWARVADMPEPLTHAATVIDGTIIYLIGGYVGDHPGPATTHVWRYDTAADAWSPGVDLPQPRGAGAGALLGRTLHYLSGTDRPAGAAVDVDQADHWALDLDAPSSWTRRAPLPNPRNHLGAAALNGRLYAIGGQHGREEATTNQSQVDVYDAATDAWRRAASLPVGRGHVAVAATADRLLVIGGTLDGNVPAADVTAYEPRLDLWLALPSLPDGRKTPVVGMLGSWVFVAQGSGPEGATSSTWSGAIFDSWESAAALPVALGEVAGGIIGDQLYLVGEGSPATLGLDLATGQWASPTTLPERPFPGHHHAAEVVDGKLYLLGGLGAGAGKLQIFDPAAGTWSLGPDMPFAAGSTSSAVIESRIYVAGGIVGSSTTTEAAVYDPATGAWRSLAPMKQGRNHAASGSDGSRMWVFGGRGPRAGTDGNVLDDGFDTVQVYDPATDTWISSLDGGSAIAPLPQARGGTGKAAFFDGEFYVVGGETGSGAGATERGVYHRLDIYDPAGNSWRVGPALPTARHGIFPLLIGGRLYVAGGGVQAGASTSAIVEVANLAGRLR